MEMRAGHPERCEDTLSAKLRERFARYASDYLCRERVSAIGVKVFGTRREVEFLLPEEHAKDLVLRDDIFHAPTRQAESLPLIAHAARMLQ